MIASGFGIGTILYYIIISSGLNPMNLPGIIFGVVYGAFKTVKRLLVGLSVATIVSGLIWFIKWILLPFAISIGAPPLDMLVIAPSTLWLQSVTEWAYPLAFTVTYALFFIGAWIYLGLWWFYLRHIKLM